MLSFVKTNANMLSASPVYIQPVVYPPRTVTW